MGPDDFKPEENKQSKEWEYTSWCKAKQGLAGIENRPEFALDQPKGRGRTMM